MVKGCGCLHAEKNLKTLDKNLVAAVMNASRAAVRANSESFLLKSSPEFASRSGDVFSSLKTLEMDHKDWMTNNETFASFEDLNNNEVMQNPPEDFKKPFAPIAQKRKATEPSPLTAKRNMKKWIKYSLADVPISSDATNAAVAFEFLSDIRRRKDEEEMEVTSSSDDKIVFCKPKKTDSKSCHTAVASGSTSEIIDISDQNSQNSEGASSQKVVGFLSSVTLHHLHNDLDEAS